MKPSLGDPFYGMRVHVRAESFLGTFRRKGNNVAEGTASSKIYTAIYLQFAGFFYSNYELLSF